jgi:periplasmic protein TonB
MKTLTAPTSYGYQELRRVHHRYMMLALFMAITIQLMAIGTYHLAEWLRPEDPIIIIKIKRPIDIPQPPSIKRESLPQSPISTLQTKAENALPVPIPDAIADSEKTIESQDKLSWQTGPILAKGNEKIEIDETGMDLDPLPNAVQLFEKDPMVVKTAVPEYPNIAQRVGLEGNVTVQVLLDKEGKVKKTLLSKTSDNIFVDVALNAAKKWVFTPALMNGKPVPVWVSIPFRFRLTSQ